MRLLLALFIVVFSTSVLAAEYMYTWKSLYKGKSFPKNRPTWDPVIKAKIVVLGKKTFWLEYPAIGPFEPQNRGCIDCFETLKVPSNAIQDVGDKLCQMYKTHKGMFKTLTSDDARAVEIEISQEYVIDFSNLDYHRQTYRDKYFYSLNASSKIESHNLAKLPEVYPEATGLVQVRKIICERINN